MQKSHFGVRPPNAGRRIGPYTLVPLEVPLCNKRIRAGAGATWHEPYTTPKAEHVTCTRCLAALATSREGER